LEKINLYLQIKEDEETRRRKVEMPVTPKPHPTPNLLAAPFLAASPHMKLSIFIQAMIGARAAAQYAGLDQYLKDQMATARLPGLVASIEDVLWEGAYGVLDTRTNVPVELDSIFVMCSVSKTIMTVAAMKVVAYLYLRKLPCLQCLWQDLPHVFRRPQPVPSDFPRSSMHSFLCVLLFI
jgi:hypothetical protein